jgi:hypothetical protein
VGGIHRGKLDRTEKFEGRKNFVYAMLFVVSYDFRKFCYVILIWLQSYEWLSYVHMIDSERKKIHD